MWLLIKNRLRLQLRTVLNECGGCKRCKHPEFKSFNFKWLTLYVRNRFRPKIFGSNLSIYRLESGL
jgi:hypothetical protein